MRKNCLVTDNSIQFLDGKPSYLGELTIVNHEMTVAGSRCAFPSHSKHELTLPSSIGRQLGLQVTPPNSMIYIDLFKALSQKYGHIFCITTSSGISASYNNAQLAAKKNKYNSHIHVYDSQTISLGLGHIVKAACHSIMAEDSFDVTDSIIRSNINRSYSILATPNSTYLNSNDYIDYSQALSLDILGLIGIYSLENGRLNPLEKVKSYQSFIEYAQEFINEFDELRFIGFVQSQNSPEKKPLHCFIRENYPDAVFNQERLSPLLSTLLGPGGMGLFLVESDEAA